MRITHVVVIFFLCFFQFGCSESSTPDQTSVLIQSAESGDADAQNELGDLYFSGEGVEENYLEGAKWFRKAADQGHAEAQYRMSIISYNGLGVPEDIEASVKWLSKSAEQGYSKAEHRLALFYRDGLGVPKDIEASVKWLSKSAEQGYSKAEYLLGLYYSDGLGVTQNSLEAAKWFRKAAEQGYADAQFLMGIISFNGEGVPKDPEAAAMWYRKAADQGKKGAQYYLGLLYQDGIGVSQNSLEAEKWYSKAAEQGHGDAQFLLGLRYLNGISLERDLNEGVKLITMSAEQGNAKAQYRLGELYYHGAFEGSYGIMKEIPGVKQDILEAAKWYGKAAEQGNAGAQLQLANCLSKGEGLDQDLAGAFTWYRRAAEQDNGRAQFKLAEIYLNGYGTARNVSKGLKWYHKAAELEDEDAMLQLANLYFDGELIDQDYEAALELYELLSTGVGPRWTEKCRVGHMYYYGYGVEADFSRALAWYEGPYNVGHKEALEWVRIAAKDGHADAQYLFGQMYLEGKGVEQDPTEAAKWYRKAAERGHVVAQILLARMYYLGEELNRDYAQAANWYRRAAEQGSPEGQFYIGAFHYDGLGVDQDYTEAAKWYRKAAEQGNIGGQYYLGVSYHEGRGVSEDYTEAAKWYRKAAEQGSAEAQCVLGKMYDKGEGVDRDHAEAVKWFRKAAEQGHELARALLVPIDGAKVETEVQKFENGVGIEMVRIPGDNYWIASTETTQKQWGAVMSKNPSYERGVRLPVNNVLHKEAMEFCLELTATERMNGNLPKGYVYSLPTDRQWEKACRAGTTGDYAGDLDEMGWYLDNSKGNRFSPQMVASKRPNAWGIYDMHGNIAEWSAEPVDEDRGIVRGGSTYFYAHGCTSSDRKQELLGARTRYVGFRVALVLQKPEKESGLSDIAFPGIPVQKVEPVSSTQVLEQKPAIKVDPKEVRQRAYADSIDMPEILVEFLLKYGGKLITSSDSAKQVGRTGKILVPEIKEWRHDTKSGTWRARVLGNDGLDRNWEVMSSLLPDLALNSDCHDINGRRRYTNFIGATEGNFTFRTIIWPDLGNGRVGSSTQIDGAWEILIEP